jgi:hypothetical protein
MDFNVFQGSLDAANMITNSLLDNVFISLFEKNLHKKVNPYTILHTFQYFSNEINFNYRGPDRKIDDKYLDSGSAEEPSPPGRENWATKDPNPKKL